MSSQQISSLEMLWTKCTLKGPCIACWRAKKHFLFKKTPYKSPLIVANTVCLQRLRAAHALRSDQQLNLKNTICLKFSINFGQYVLPATPEGSSRTSLGPVLQILASAEVPLAFPRTEHTLCLEQLNGCLFQPLYTCSASGHLFVLYSCTIPGALPGWPQ